MLFVVRLARCVLYCFWQINDDDDDDEPTYAPAA